MPRTYRKDLFVTDVADLTAMISHVDNDLAMLDDNTIYRFEITSLATHDGAAVVRPANIAEDAPGRWLRTYAPSGGGFVQDPGRLASNTLHLADDVVDGETVTIGDEVYEAQVINTDSTDNTANGDFNSEDSPLVVPGAVQRYANIDFVEGLVIRIEDEMLRVTAINPNGMVTFARAQSFTEVAAHVDAVDIFVGPGPTEEGNILVGLNTELANWHFLTALSLDITEHSANVHAEAPDEFAMMIWPKTDDFTMALACSHTLSASGATWTRDEMFGNEAPGNKRIAFQVHVVNAAEAACGYIAIVFPSDFIIAKVLVTRAQDGSAHLLEDDYTGFANMNNNVVTISPGGAAPLTEGDRLTLIVAE